MALESGVVRSAASRLGVVVVRERGAASGHTYGAAANAPRLGSVTFGVPVGVHRSPRKVRLPLVALRTACAPWLRVLVPRRPPPRPSLRSPSATGHSQPLFAKLRAPACGPGFVPQPAPRPAAPVAAAAAHHFGSCLAFVAFARKSAARSSRSRRLRCRQGILPVKTLGGESPASQPHPPAPKLLTGAPP